jgi:hypothetical protein
MALPGRQSLAGWVTVGRCVDPILVGGSGRNILRHLPRFSNEGALSLFVRLFLRGTRRLRQIGWAPRSSGGVVLVAIFVVPDDLAWSLLPTINVSVFCSSSRVSDSDRRCNALRSRAREKGLSVATEMDHGILPFGVCAG